jgi:hypothetical protein
MSSKLAATLWLFLLYYCAVVFAAAHNQTVVATRRNLLESIVDESSSSSPVIYTYFERIPLEDRTTGMLDDDDDRLLAFWKDIWSQAGWKTVLLTLEDAKIHPQYDEWNAQLVHLNLDIFSCVLWHRWMAMATRGGWYADYDVVPLLHVDYWSKSTTTLPNDGRMTVHDIMSPSLASGSAEQWALTLQVLLEDAKHHTSPNEGQQTFWTDSLAMNSYIKNNNVVGKASPKAGDKAVGMPYDVKDPVATNYSVQCSAVLKSNKWAVHFGPGNVQKAKYVPAKLRLPKHRVTLAKEWIRGWQKVCPEFWGNGVVLETEEA